MSKNKVMLTKRERKRQNIAIAVMFLFILPVAVMFASFFLMAFFKDGHLSLENFEFVIRPMKLRDQTTIPAIGKALRNSVIFTVCVTIMEVITSLMAGYALSRLDFRGRKDRKSVV